MLVRRMVWFSVRGMGIVCSEYVERAVLAEVSGAVVVHVRGRARQKGAFCTERLVGPEDCAAGKNVCRRGKRKGNCLCIR